MDTLKNKPPRQAHRAGITRIVFLIALVVIPVWISRPSIVRALSSPSEPPVKVYTEYQGPSHLPTAAPKTWIIQTTSGRKTSGEKTSPEKTSDDLLSTVKWEIYSAGSDAPLCSIEIMTDGASGREGSSRIVMTDLTSGRERGSDNGLFILPGYPAPCNVLPVHQTEPEKFYDEKRRAGGRVFVRRYRVFWEIIPWESALKDGWVKTSMDPGVAVETADRTADSPSVSRRLKMLTVVDDTETPVVRQLWSEGDPWWIYEETPFKRSWRVE